MSRAPSSLCRCLESLVGLEAVRDEWQRGLSDDWQWASALLRPTGRIADCYPKLEADEQAPGGPRAALAYYRIVWRDEDKDLYVGSCPDGGGRVELRRADLVVYELDRKALARRLADAMGLVFDYVEHSDIPTAVRIGLREPMLDAEEWVYLVIQSDARRLGNALARLAIYHERPCVVLTPTRSWWRGRPEAIRDRARVSAIEDTFIVSPSGSWTLRAAQPEPRNPQRSKASASDEPASTKTGAPHVGPVVGGNEEVILRALLTAKKLLSQDELWADLDETDESLSIKTISAALKALRERGLVNYPDGPRSGVGLTDAGRAFAGQLPPRRRQSAAD